MDENPYKAPGDPGGRTNSKRWRERAPLGIIAIVIGASMLAPLIKKMGAWLSLFF